MKFKMFAMVAVAVIAVASTGSSALAQGCGCGSYSGVIPGSYGGFGGFGGVGIDNSCGRGISSSQAASLWGGYCTESCAYTGPQRQRRGCCLFKGRHGGGGCLGGGGGSFGGGCGFNQGCFGYPSGGCGCGCSSARGGCGGGHGCRLKRKFAGLHSGGGCCGGGYSSISSIGSYGGCSTCNSCPPQGGCGGGHGCRLKQKLARLHSGRGAVSSCGRGGCLRGGCGVKGRFFNNMLARHSQYPYTGYSSTNAMASCSYLTSGGGGGCSTCGSNGGYFNEAVGYEYGNGGMQSVVSGSLTSACGCGGGY